MCVYIYIYISKLNNILIRKSIAKYMPKFFIRGRITWLFFYNSCTVMLYICSHTRATLCVYIYIYTVVEKSNSIVCNFYSVIYTAALSIACQHSEYNFPQQFAIWSFWNIMWHLILGCEANTGHLQGIRKKNWQFNPVLFSSFYGPPQKAQVTNLRGFCLLN